MSELTQEGTFRGRILSYGLYQSDAGAKAVTMTVAVDEIWSEGEWHDWREHGFEVDGRIWVIKKDGSMIENNIQSLVNYAGWGANFGQLLDKSWEPKSIQFDVEENEWKNNVTYKIAWVKAFDATPGGGNVSPEKAKELDGQFGSQLRAMTGNTQRAAQKPAAAPKKPKTKKPAKADPQHTTDAVNNALDDAATDDNIPF